MGVGEGACCQGLTDEPRVLHTGLSSEMNMKDYKLAVDEGEHVIARDARVEQILGGSADHD